MKLEGRAEYKVVSHKAEKREKTRLIKAEKSAVIENHIVNELLKNLKEGKYDGIYNINHNAFNTILEKEKAISVNQIDEDFNEDDYDKGYIEDFSDEEEENEEDEGNEDDIEQKEKSEKSDEEEIDDIFKESKDKKSKDNSKKDKKTGKKRKRHNIEYEQEYETIKKNVNYNMISNNNNDNLDDYL